jgi:hypothetical protein
MFEAAGVGVEAIQQTCRHVGTDREVECVEERGHDETARGRFCVDEFDIAEILGEWVVVNLDDRATTVEEFRMFFLPAERFMSPASTVMTRSISA